MGITTIEIESDDIFSTSEYVSRIIRLQQLLKKSDIDVLIVNWRPDLYYFSGSAQDAHCIVPSEGNPTLLVRRDVSRAKEESWIDSVFQITGFRDLTRMLLDVIDSESDGSSEKKVALTFDVLPTSYYLRLRELFPKKIELVEGSSLVRQVRACKSKQELEFIRVSAEITKTGHQAVYEALRPGMTERELCAVASKAMLEVGHQGFVFFRAWNNEMLPQGHCISGISGTIPSYVSSPNGGLGYSRLLPQGASNRKIRKHEPILVDLVGSYHGYCADETRTYSMGKLPELARNYLDLCIEIQEYLRISIRPHILPREIYDQVLDFYRENVAAKLKDARHSVIFMADQQGVGFMGHGVGLEIDEWPVISQSFSLPFQEGNVMAIEPKIRISRIGLVGIENTFSLTRESLVQVTSSDLPTS